MIIGGAGPVGIFGSCLIISGPGVGGLGGFKYLIDKSWTLSTQPLYLSLTNSGFESLLIAYSEIGISPLQLSTSALLSQIPRIPFISIISTSLAGIGCVELLIDSSIRLTYGGRFAWPEHGSHGL